MVKGLIVGIHRWRQYRANVEPACLPVIDRGLYIKTLHVSDHFLDRAKSELRHQFTHFFSDEFKEINHELWLASKALAQLWVLRRDTNWTGIQMTHPHHHAAGNNQRRRCKTKLLSAKQRRNHNVPAGLQLTISLYHDSITQAIQ